MVIRSHPVRGRQARPTETLLALRSTTGDSPLTTVCCTLALADEQKTSVKTAMAPRKGLADTETAPLSKGLDRTRFTPPPASPLARDGYVAMQEKLRKAAPGWRAAATRPTIDPMARLRVALVARDGF